MDRKIVLSQRFTQIVSNDDSLDWKGLSSDEIQRRVVERVKPGSICLFHNAVENTPAALETILKELTDDGYIFVPVSELIYTGKYTIDHEGRQIPQM